MSVISPANTPVETNNDQSAPAQGRGGRVRSIGQWVSYIVLLIAALGALVMIVVPVVTGSQTYTVLTSSMAPKYAPGTFLVVKPTPFADLQVGDIITYQIESGKPGVISHRIIAVTATQNGDRVLTTKGDNNSLADSTPVQAAQVKGKLLYAVPYVGFAANAIGQDRDVILPVIAVGFIGFGAFSMIKGAVEKKRTRHAARDGQ